MRHLAGSWTFLIATACMSVISCGGGDENDTGTLPPNGNGGSGATGGSAQGGTAGAGGQTGGSGGAAKGGAGGTAGAAGKGGGAGNAGQGGVSGQGGASGTGGASGQGGASGTGGASGQGGASGTGGTSGQGGASGTGGASGQGGTGGGGMCTPGAQQPCYTGPNGTQNTGLCHGGQATCAQDGMSWGPCVGEVTPVAESCATTGDDDCNGTANDGCLCTPGSSQACYSGPGGTQNVGICHGGQATCAADGKSLGPCVGEVTPQTEDCATAADEDCNGSTPACPTIVDLRADVNRNGTVDLTDPTEDASEDTWDATHGAIFLANIDDDQDACPNSGTDANLAACNDAADTVINGTSDLEDLARLKTVPWPAAPNAASATLTINAAAQNRVRLFKGSGATFSLYTPGATLTSTELKAGIEFGIEARDIIRDDTVWDGYVDVTFNVNPGSGPVQTDVVRLRVAPVLFRHHLDEPETVYATQLNSQSSLIFRSELSAAMTASGIANPLYNFAGISDQWTQDFFETAYMSMPRVGGQKVIHVNFRSANYASNGLRTAGRVVFTVLRGPDVAGAVQYDPNHANSMDTLNSFGNLETVPPYGTWPMGRVIRGSTANFYPDTSFDRMIRAQGAGGGNTQGIQDPIAIDTEWLLVGHIDETFSFYKSAQGTHGWKVLWADTQAGWNALDNACPPNCNTVMFQGTSGQTTIGAVVGDTDLANANAWAISEIDNQKTQLKQATGITDADFTPVPAVWWEQSNYLVAYVPGIVNGISLGTGHYGPPRPHGPVIGGEDLFVTLTTQSLQPVGLTSHWIEDWTLYHVLDGEVHCGSNTTRMVPASARWWEGGK
ncbi:MAG: hypothetical protein HY898_00990 [Deltaproteobacteria bacterium]|nr:hypothetical protein [Deltaproteobacteria bacterium]